MTRLVIGILGLALGALGTPAAAAQAAAAPRPHILYVVADDLGWNDVGFHGSEIATPTLDGLAAGGARLQQFYVQSMCTPTRAALMTGRYPLRYGLQTGVILSSHRYGLPIDEWLLPQALAEAGYATAIVGKWHLGHADPKYWPGQRGFQSQYGPLIGEIDYFTHEQHGVVDWYRDGRRVVEPGYSTTLLGDEAVRRIEGHDPERPLFLYLAFNAPHTPYQAPPEALARYAHVADPSRRAYAASITVMDEQIARVLAALEARGMRDRTLVVFHSDNGGTYDPLFAGEGDLSKAEIPCDNGPYREGKGSLYEGGTRAVAFAHWPGRIRPGEVDGLVHVVDVFPTLARLAGASTARSKPLDGVDVWPTVSEGRVSPRSEVVYNVEPFRAGVRRGDWKLVWRAMLPSSVELYDVARDPSEREDVSALHPGQVAELQKRANQLAAAMAKPMLVETELGVTRERLSLPPALPEEPAALEPGSAGSTGRGSPEAGP